MECKSNTPGKYSEYIVYRVNASVEVLMQNM